VLDRTRQLSVPFHHRFAPLARLVLRPLLLVLRRRLLAYRAQTAPLLLLTALPARAVNRDTAALWITPLVFNVLLVST
jgi:hypothetical protein